MNKSVQDFLRFVNPPVYFETTLGIFRVISREGEFGYNIQQQTFEGWNRIPTFDVKGELQPNKTKHLKKGEF